MHAEDSLVDVLQRLGHLLVHHAGQSDVGHLCSARAAVPLHPYRNSIGTSHLKPHICGSASYVRGHWEETKAFLVDAVVVVTEPYERATTTGEPREHVALLKSETM